MAVTVTRKSQVTIPKPVRDRLDFNPGSKVDFEVSEDGRALLRRVGRHAV
jgi:antitoxin PrlF